MQALNLLCEVGLPRPRQATEQDQRWPRAYRRLSGYTVMLA